MPVPSASANVPPRPTVEPIAEDPPPLGLEEVASGLVAPIGIASAPDGWLLVNERFGRAIAIDPDGARPSVALDITDRVRGVAEQGLLGLVLHPEWPDQPRAFIHYSDVDGDTVVSELRGTSEGGRPVLDPASERVLLREAQPFANHNGGQVAFGPDGYLYLGLGDGGSGGDPLENAQNPGTRLGKILRIDVDSDESPYGIPPENPFVGGAEGHPEVFLIGLRNPWRFSFDRTSGLLWIADVGQNALEEIDRMDPAIDAGANLGWNEMEASDCYLADCSTDGLVLPVAEYGRDLGCSVTGGHVYRGSAIDGLGGWYVFSDYCSGLLFGVPSDAEGVNDPRVLLDTGGGVTAFGEDSAGELYITHIHSGTVYRLVAGG